MSLLKRITKTINASMNSVVSRVEDHDAIIDASIKESRQAAARTRARLSKVRRDGVHLRASHERAANDMALWADRAVQMATTDEENALKCLKRKNLVEAHAFKLEQSIADHGQIENKLQTQLGQIEKRITEISQKRNTMRSRQSLAEAMRIMDELDGDSGSTVDDTFERWESILLERELVINDEYSVDQFETQFLEREEFESLRNELKILSADRQVSSDE